jgi:hypothetical protein
MANPQPLLGPPVPGSPAVGPFIGRCRYLGTLDWMDRSYLKDGNSVCLTQRENGPIGLGNDPSNPSIQGRGRPRLLLLDKDEQDESCRCRRGLPVARRRKARRGEEVMISSRIRPITDGAKPRNLRVLPGPLQRGGGRAARCQAPCKYCQRSAPQSLFVTGDPTIPPCGTDNPAPAIPAVVRHPHGMGGRLDPHRRPRRTRRAIVAPSANLVP